MTDINKHGRGGKPEWARELRARLSSLQLPPAREAEIIEELSQHLDDRLQELIAAGATLEAAARLTLDEFDAERLARYLAPLRQSRSSEIRMPAGGWSVWGGAVADLRCALRALRAAPGLTVVAIVVLALGIGAATAVFAVFDAALLRTLPVDAPERLVLLNKIAADGDADGSFAYPVFRDLRDRGSAVFDPVAYWLTRVSVDAGNQAERLPIELVSGNYFQALGIRPARGRMLTPADDDHTGEDPVAVISNAYWQRSLGGAESALGSTVRINGFPFTIVGIAPPRFHGFTVGSPAVAQVPMAMQGQVAPDWQVLERPYTSWHRILGRLEPGVSVAGAQSALNAVFQQIVRERLAGQGELPPGVKDEILAERLDVEPAARGLSAVPARYGPPLRILMSVVGLLLLIACANFANLLLTRGIARAKEIALREALGAGRARIVRQLMLESVILALVGGAVALIPAIALARALLSLLPAGTSPTELAIDLDARLAFFSTVLSILTGAIFGAVPGWMSSRVDFTSVVKGFGAQTGERRATTRLRRGLVVVQLALAMALLIGTGVLARTLYNLTNVELGFRQENLLLVGLSPSEIGYTKKTAPALYDQLLTTVQAVPGVRAATVALVDVLNAGGRRETIAVPGYAARTGENMNVDVNIVGPRYLETLGIPLALGRDLERTDTGASRRVAVVNEAFVRRFLHTGDPLGREIHFGAIQPGSPGLEVVGVIRDTKYHTVRTASVPVVYVPLSQEPADDMTMYVWTAVPPASVLSSIRRGVAGVDAALPVFNARTVSEQLDQALVQERSLAVLSSAAGIVALILSVVGLYGMVSYNLGRRIREIGLRLALGADRATLLKQLLTETGVMLLLGAAAGCSAAALLLRLIREQLYGVSPLDPLTAVAALIVVGVVGATAGLIPALRAIRCDPAAALRFE